MYENVICKAYNPFFRKHRLVRTHLSQNFRLGGGLKRQLVQGDKIVEFKVRLH